MVDVWLRTGWLIPLYPLIGSALTIPWSPAFIRRTGPRPAGYINLITTLVALVHSLMALSSVWGHAPLRWDLTWVRVADLAIPIPFEFSALALAATSAIAGINLLVQIYAMGYLEMDWGWARFYALLALFEAGMSTLVLCDSVFVSYMLLEILTLGTYLIVGYWFNQSLVVTGARDAFLTKRVGDLILLMGVIALYPLAGTWSYTGLAEWAEHAQMAPGAATLLGFALLAGPMSKCAQFPLHLWLDEAMEAPLPTSIMRNAVVVPVGAWVMIKLTPVLALSPLVDTITVTVGAVTAVGAVLIAIAQIDAKRVLSYLVSSYMGLVFVAVGAQEVGAAFFLLFAYAISMATLFTSVGSIILTCVTQDLTQMGGLLSRRPITAISFLIGMFSFIAMPPLGSFWAMRALVEGLLQDGLLGIAALVLGLNLLMALSLMRMFGLIFFGPVQPMSERAPEPIWLVVLPMAIMAAITLHIPIILNTLALLPLWRISINSVGGFLLVTSLLGIALGFIIYGPKRTTALTRIFPQPLVDLFAYDFYTPTIYRNTVILAVGTLAKVGDWIDRYVVDGAVNLVGLASLVGGETLKYNNTGRSQFYVLTITLFVALLGVLMGLLALPELSQGLLGFRF